MKNNRTSKADAPDTTSKTAGNESVNKGFISPAALFFCVDASMDLREIEAVCSRAKKDFNHIEVIIFSLKKGETEQLFKDRTVLTKKDFNFLGRLRRNVSERLKKVKVPLLIVFPGAKSKYCNKIVRKIHAEIKAGADDAFQNELLNFTIKNPSSNKIVFETFYEQLVYYVRSMGLMNG